MDHPNLATIISFTGKLNRVEKSKVNAALEANKNIGQILDEIALFREKVSLEEKKQDEKNDKVKNVSKSPTETLEKLKPKPSPLTPYEKQEVLRKQIREKTNQYINLQNKHCKQRCKLSTY